MYKKKGIKTNGLMLIEDYVNKLVIITYGT